MSKVKNIILNKINTGNVIDQNSLYTKLLSYSYVTFDIFDTLLKRNVSDPTQVFDLIEKKVGKIYPEFKKIRIEAEKQAMLLSSEQEVTLHEIYKQYPNINDEQITFLINIELETEKRVLTRNPDIWPIYRRCLQEGKKVYLISDMYLSKVFIERVLQELDIIGYEQLYVSSESRKTKRKGDSFNVFLDENGIKAQDVIHIGDSIKSDYQIPKSLGIDAIHIPRNVKRSRYILQNKEKKIEIEYLNSFINNSVPIEKDEYFRFGYEKFGMFLWGYAKWLLKSVKERGIKKIYFFSRDGLIMKKAFDICNTDKGICTYYLEVSRRSLRVPILWMDISFASLLDMLSPSKLISLEMIFDGVGLNIDEYRTVIENYGLKKESVFDRKDILQNKALLKLYEKLIPDIKKNSQKEYEFLREYISQNYVGGKFAIVDIGWSGGMQRYLEQTLDKLNIKHEISGYYIGIASYYTRNIKSVPNLDLNGYLFDFFHNSEEKDKRSSFVGLFETLFLEQGGSVKNYVKDSDESIVANRYQYEYIQNGRPTDEYVKVQQIQNGALEFIKLASYDDQLNEFTFCADELFSGIKQTGTQPSKSDLNMFADFRFFDEGETQKLADPANIFYYIVHFSKFKKDFLQSRWKIGFMKKMIGIKLPYETIYNQLLNLK